MTKHLEPFRDKQAALDRAAQAVGPDPITTPTTNGHTWNWTAQSLRGIPAIGRGVSGAIPDSEPGYNLDDWPTPDEDVA